MDNVVLPRQEEDFRFGMNNLDPAHKLGPNVLQLLQNAFPGLSLKPRNGLKDNLLDSTQLGYGTEDTRFRPHSVHFYANEKDWVFCWAQNVTDESQYELELWNVTDSSRTKIVYGDYPSTSVYFGMEKLYNAIYLVMDQEMSTNHVSECRTKNQIIEWDTATSDWVVRAMAIDVSPAPVVISVEGVSNADLPLFVDGFGRIHSDHCIYQGRVFISGGWGADTDKAYSSDDMKTWRVEGTLPVDLSFHKMVVYDGKMWICGGTAAQKVYYSTDGETWTEAGTDSLPESATSPGFVVYDNKMWMLTIGTALSEKAYYSTDGITWTEKGTDALPTVDGASALVYDNKMWIIGGDDGGAKKKVWSSSDGETWTEAGTDSLPFAADAPRVTVYDGEMWIVQDTNLYSSTDGITWTSEGAPPLTWGEGNFFSFKNQLWLVGGYDFSSTYYSQIYYTTDGVTWSTFLNGIAADLYVSTTFTFVRRNDSASKLASVSAYVYDSWKEYAGVTRPGIDEKLLTATVTLTGTGANNLVGVGTAFTTELATGDYVRIDGTNNAYEINAIQDDTNLTLDNTVGHSYTAKNFSIIPAVGSSITVETYNEGLGWGIEDLDNRQSVKILTSSDYGVLLIPMPAVADAVAQGATHIRYYRTLGNASRTVAEGLDHRFVADIAIIGDTYSAEKVYRDIKTDASLNGQTNTLDVTGFEVPPLGRYITFAGGVLWIGGNPDNPGFWFHSALPSNVQFPEKFASMFALSSQFVTCDPDDGQKDTGTAAMSGDLFFWKERKVFALDNADFNNIPRRISSAIGCICPQSIVNADIPILGGECVLFLSSMGPAILRPGDRVDLLKEFKIESLWPGGLVLENTDGTPTSFYTRNKVYSTFWKNTWWVLYGDSDDSGCELTTFKMYGFRFGDDGDSIGPFEFTFPQSGGQTIYEPQVLVPIDGERAYTLSHKGAV